MKRKFLAILLSLAMLFTLLPPGATLAASPSYVALGDSITTGYGLAEGETAFPTTVMNNVGATLTNLAADGETSASLLDKLTNESNEKYTDVTSAVQSADMITLTIGGNDLMDALYAYLAEKYNEGKDESAQMTAEDIKALLANPSQNNIITLYSLINYLPDFQPTNAVTSFSGNLGNIISQIKAKNDDVLIVVATQYDPYERLNASDNPSLSDPIGKIKAAFSSGVSALNRAIHTASPNFSTA